MALSLALLCVVSLGTQSWGAPPAVGDQAAATREEAPTPIDALEPRAIAEVILLSEVFAGTPDYLELYNSGEEAVSLDGWRLETTGCGSVAIDTKFLPAIELEAGEYLKVLETSGTNTNDTIYLDSNICWVDGEEGSAAVVAPTLLATDFVRWGGSAIGPPVGTFWSEPYTLLSPTGIAVQARGAPILDTDSPQDWCLQASTAPGPNDRCGIKIFVGDEDGAVPR
jgi:hypothetical protein